MGSLTSVTRPSNGWTPTKQLRRTRTRINRKSSREFSTPSFRICMVQVVMVVLQEGCLVVVCPRVVVCQVVLHPRVVLEELALPLKKLIKCLICTTNIC